MSRSLVNTSAIASPVLMELIVKMILTNASTDTVATDLCAEIGWQTMTVYVMEPDFKVSFLFYLMIRKFREKLHRRHKRMYHTKQLSPRNLYQYKRWLQVRL